jgi:phosphoglycolate phosphatase
VLDLDGTLVDSAAGATASVVTALMAVGAPIPDTDSLFSFVGPPMYQTFREVVGLDELTAQRALRLYRADYAERGAVHSRVYDGFPACWRRWPRPASPWRWRLRRSRTRLNGSPNTTGWSHTS